MKKVIYPAFRLLLLHRSMCVLVRGASFEAFGSFRRFKSLQVATHIAPLNEQGIATYQPAGHCLLVHTLRWWWHQRLGSLLLSMTTSRSLRVRVLEVTFLLAYSTYYLVIWMIRKIKCNSLFQLLKVNRQHFLLSSMSFSSPGPPAIHFSVHTENEKCPHC